MVERVEEGIVEGSIRAVPDQARRGWRWELEVAGEEEAESVNGEQVAARRRLHGHPHRIPVRWQTAAR
jgi:hypothetical protein